MTPYFSIFAILADLLLCAQFDRVLPLMLEQVYVFSVVECSSRCNELTDCDGFAIDRRSSLCQLLNDEAGSVGPGTFKYFNRGGYPNQGCISNYCHNAVSPCNENGLCEGDCGAERHICKCYPGFLGADCSVAGPMSTLPSVTIPIVYIACYTDDEGIGVRDLPYNLTTSPTMTPTVCTEHCYQGGFLFAAVQAGNECRCSNTYGRYGEMATVDSCNVPCAGDAGQMCGAIMENSVFATPIAPPPTTPCLTNGVSFNSICYIFVSPKLLWDEAEDDCVINHGGHLAVIDSAELQVFMEYNIMLSGHASHWFGLYYNTTASTYMYTTGDALSYTNWFDNEPSLPATSHCIELRSRYNYKWNDEVCSQTRSYICQVT